MKSNKEIREEVLEELSDTGSLDDMEETINSTIQKYKEEAIDLTLQKYRAEVEKIIDEFGETKCGFMDRNTCDKIDKKELKQKLKGEKL